MAVDEALVFLGFLTPVLTQLSFQSHRPLFLHASAMRGENMPERKLTSTGYRTHNHQVMSQTRSPLSHPLGREQKSIENIHHIIPFENMEILLKMTICYLHSNQVIVANRDFNFKTGLKFDRSNYLLFTFCMKSKYGRPPLL